MGNRFENNIEIVKRYLAINPRKQVILSNGEFIEQSIMSGNDPVLFIGRSNVVEEIQTFIRQSDIDVGILIGNELVGAATTVRRQLGISVFVKFAQGARAPGGAVSQVEDLDRFPMPRYEIIMSIQSVVYNEATGALEVTYSNDRGISAYFLSTITVSDEDGVKIVGDTDPVFIEGNSIKTVVYNEQQDGTPLSLQGDELSGRVFTIYGEAPGSLENTLEADIRVDRITVTDQADIEIRSLVYDKTREMFVVEIESTGDADAYVNPELIDVSVNGEQVTAGIGEPILIPQGDTEHIDIPLTLEEEDFMENEEITVRAYYGERRLSLIKVKTAVFGLEFTSAAWMIYVLIGILLLLLLLLLATRKRCRHCGHWNARKAKTCKKCHRHL
ncbi:MAG: hypothetical protein HC945_02740 [Nitrosarchaeum sp.]|nr:hypothetical protein [Nitrosarchaeum sp.]